MTFEKFCESMPNVFTHLAVATLAMMFLLDRMQDRKDDERRRARKATVRKVRVVIAVFDPALGPDAKPLLQADTDQKSAGNLLHDLCEGYVRPLDRPFS